MYKRQNEKEIMESTPFTISSSNIKYLAVYLTKQVKNLYHKPFKTLLNKTEDDI